MPNDAQMPERIWATPEEAELLQPEEGFNPAGQGMTEYIRSDLAAAIAEIERLTKERDYKQTVIEKLSDHIEKVEAERDEAQAQVAMAYKAAANASMESGPSYFMTQTGSGFRETHTKLGAFAFRTDIRDAIRALTPADAKAALESYGREKVREGMQRAADICTKVLDHNLGLPIQIGADRCKTAVLAEMEKEGGE